MKKKCLAGEECPLARGYNAIGDWWSLLILTQVVMMGIRRFCEIGENLGMAKNILTARLKKLVDEDILTKMPASDGSAYHEYVPTERGRDLYKVLIALRQWGETHYGNPCGKSTSYLVDREKNEPIRKMEVFATDGRVLGPEDVHIVSDEPVEA